MKCEMLFWIEILYINAYFIKYYLLFCFMVLQLLWTWFQLQSLQWTQSYNEWCSDCIVILLFFHLSLGQRELLNDVSEQT